MRVSIYVNENTDDEIIEHINKLKENGDSISRFFINSAKESLKALESDNLEIKAIVKEIIKEEYEGANLVELEGTDNKIDLSNKLKNVYD